MRFTSLNPINSKVNVEISGVKIPEGRLVLPVLAAGDRDP